MRGAPAFGPVITSGIQYRNREKFWIQEAGFPHFLAWLLHGSSLTSPSFYGRLLNFKRRYLMRRFHWGSRSDFSAAFAKVLASDVSERILPLLGMGADVPDGVFSLRDGRLQLEWSEKSSRKYFRTLVASMQELAAAMGGKLMRSPLTMLRKVITVHPLGGCPMGTSAETGVVDSFGRVFGYPGLYVADGSVLPGPAVANPALTIAAVGERVARGM